MFELLRIRLLGHQPAARVSDRLLNKLIERDYKGKEQKVRSILNNIKSNNKPEKNRIAAGILKLADKSFDNLDLLVKKANADSRDIITLAEYPRCAKIGFDNFEGNQMKKIYLDDYLEFSNWIKV